MKNKLLITLIVFLLLVPFRLPVSILFIRFFRWLLGETTSTPLPPDTIATNIIVTKLVYNLALSVAFLYNIEMISRQRMGRNPKDGAPESRYSDNTFCYWWCIPIGAMLLAFIIMDAININQIFFS